MKELGDRKNVVISDRKTLLVAHKNVEEMIKGYELDKKYFEQKKSELELER